MERSSSLRYRYRFRAAHRTKPCVSFRHASRYSHDGTQIPGGTTDRGRGKRTARPECGFIRVCAAIRHSTRRFPLRRHANGVDPVSSDDFLHADGNSATAGAGRIAIVTDHPEAPAARPMRAACTRGIAGDPHRAVL
ncbi:hypothetical protein KDW55_03600 [Burkholderia sp. AU19243]|uniref:hypothetical protein n=1 Tax=Burkholderia TaxID=32008 RepID=UPI0012EA0163|nr:MULTISPECIES: hypothetical protein [Burkholderia]MBR8362404.1 hypothetical protein [Burkholderia sp. AU19243]MCA8307565.1 hypothetical protein [Burkholderia sp. AU28942]QTO50590.1 hypothetical protein J8I86_23980 [Burkholderia latens]